MKGLPIIPLILIVALFASPVYGQCVDDGNNSEDDAQAIGYDETTSDWVCPDDPFDFYVLTIPGGMVVSGDIAFSSPQRSTVLRIWRDETGERFVNDVFTNEETHEFTFPVPTGRITPGTYYARIFHWSEAAFDHEYTLTLDLALTEALEPIEAVWSPIPEHGLGPRVPFRPPAAWPSRRYDGKNTGCGAVNGPGRGAAKAMDLDLLSELSVEGYEISWRYDGLVAGAGDRIYFIDRVTNEFIAYDLSEGFQWKVPVGDTRQPFCLDSYGDPYIIDPDERSISALTINGEEKWTRDIMGDGRIAELWAVGRRVYASVYMGGNLSTIYAFEKHGPLAWDSGLFPTMVSALAEDPNGYVYSVTDDGIYRYDWDGNKTRLVEYWVGPTGLPIPAPSGIGLGPVVGNDGKVWANSIVRPRYYILNPDGSVYSEDNYEIGEGGVGVMGVDIVYPVAACYGGNSRFYVAYDEGEVVCYNDWTAELWSVPFEGESRILDMIMGADDTVYVLYSMPSGAVGREYSYHWISLDPDDGSVIEDIEVEFAREIGNAYGEMVIADGGRLVILNSIGYLAVYYQPVIFATPGYTYTPPTTGG